MPKLTPFWLPSVRTLADLTPAERVALARDLGAPLSGYDADGNPLENPCREYAEPCPDPYCGFGR